jgi:uncharacterized membrane protein YgcG
MPRFHHATIVPTSTTSHRPAPPASPSIFDFAEHFMKEHEEVAPSSCDAGPPDDAMECSQPVDPSPAASQSVASASQQERPTPVYAELWGRLKWLSVINEKTLEGMYSKGDLQAMLRRHAIHAASGRKKSELAVELMRLMRAQGLSKPDEPTAASEPAVACATAITSSSAAAVTTATTIAAAAANTITTAAGVGGVGSNGALGSNSLADRLGNMCRGPPVYDDDETQPPSQSQRVVTPPAPPPPTPHRAVRAAPPAPSPGLLRRIPLPPPPAAAPASARKSGGGRGRGGGGGGGGGGSSGVPGTTPRAAATPLPPAAAARPPPQAAVPPPRAAAPSPPAAAAPVPAAALPSLRLMALSASEEQLLHSLKARAVPPAWPAGCFAALALDLARLPRATGLHSTAHSPPAPCANNAANASANTKAANAANTAYAAAAAAAATAAPSSLPTRAPAAAPAPAALRAARPVAALQPVACPNCHGHHDGAPCVAPQRGNFEAMVAKALRMVRTATADEAAAALRAAGGSFSDAVAALRRSAPLVPSRRATPTGGALHPQSSEGSGSGGWGGAGGGWGGDSGGHYEESRPCSNGANSDSDDQDCGQHAPPGGLPRAGGSSGSETEMEI